MHNNLQTTQAEYAGLPWQSVPHHTVKTAALLLGCSPGKVYAELHAGHLIGIKLAGKTLITTASIVDFIATAQPWRPDPVRAGHISRLRQAEATQRIAQAKTRSASHAKTHRATGIRARK
jgi:hypothetical protein